MTLCRRVCAIVFAAALIVTVGAGPASAIDLNTYEKQIAFKTNQERTNRNLAALRADACINNYAEWHAAWMARNRRLVHQDLSKIMTACKLSRVGENIASGSTGPFPTGYRVMAAWMASPGHRTNLLNPSFRLQGDGAAATTVDGSTIRYFSHVFGTAR